MILTHPTLEKMIYFDGDHINVLVVENPTQLSLYVSELFEQSQGLTGSFSLFDDNEKIEPNGRIKIIIDPFNIDLNSKEIISSINSKLSSIATDQDHYMLTNELLTSIEKYVLNLSETANILMECKDLTIQDLIKMCSIKLIPSGDRLIDTLCDYIDALFKYTKTVLIVIINIREFLSEKDIVLINEHILYNKYNVLFIESSEHPILQYELPIIIDKNLCEIHSSSKNETI